MNNLTIFLISFDVIYAMSNIAIAIKSENIRRGVFVITLLLLTAFIVSLYLYVIDNSSKVFLLLTATLLAAYTMGINKKRKTNLAVRRGLLKNKV